MNPRETGTSTSTRIQPIGITLFQSSSRAVAPVRRKKWQLFHRQTADMSVDEKLLLLLLLLSPPPTLVCALRVPLLLVLISRV